MTPPGPEGTRPIRRLLVANRGEIARRIARGARGVGALVVAVYAESDAASPYVREADVAVPLAGKGARETYLDIGKLVDAARATGADAVHPGYGFLSERAEFAAAVIEAGLVWVGPPPEVIAAMGDKLSAKSVMADAAVPILETLLLCARGELDAVALDAAALAMSGPLMVKAAAGGGGRAMRLVNSPSELAAAVASVRREAADAFGDPTVFAEAYVPDARHVEIQILADDYGNVVHLFERDCSIQRRHQKLVEEAPSPALDPELRDRMGEMALAVARAVGYRNAGTVEFVLDTSGAFFFLEVNTRLQVEHPVTEEITGVDLVREQLQIAAGFPLSFAQSEFHIDGHAVEARLYAEDPATGFLPVTGTIVEWAPALEPGLRWESGVETGSVVGDEWDPLLAKVVAHAPTRAEASLRLALGLERSRIRGVKTNRDFLVSALRHDAFVSGGATTSFVERVDVMRDRTVAPGEVVFGATAATLVGCLERHQQATVLASLPLGWYTGALPVPSTTFVVEALEWAEVTVSYRSRRDGSFEVGVLGPGIDTGPLDARFHGFAGGVVDLELSGKRAGAHVLTAGETTWVQSEHGDLVLHESVGVPGPELEAVAGSLVAPMPGRVVEVAAEIGTVVSPGDVLVVIEAMKMEHAVTARQAGTVSGVQVRPGDQVRAGDLLVLVDAP